MYLKDLIEKVINADNDKIGEADVEFLGGDCRSKYANLESRINDLIIIMEKYDFQSITDNMRSAFEKIEATNSRMNEGIASWNKQKKELLEHNMIDKPLNNDEIIDFRNETVELKKEVKSYAKSYELLMATVNEKENFNK